MKTIRGRFRAAVLMGAAASVLAFAAGAKAQNQTTTSWPYGFRQSAAERQSVALRNRRPLARAGGGWRHRLPARRRREQVRLRNEVCTDPNKAPYTSTSLWQSQEATANQIEAMKPDAVALLGDLQYQVGRYSDFEQSFDLTYGAFKFLQRPAPGNHEFYDEHGETGVAGYGYFSYFNGFQINTQWMGPVLLTTTIPDPCPPNPACGPGATLSGLTSPQPVPRADGQAGHFDGRTRTEA
jgi:hypothetical protein